MLFQIMTAIILGLIAGTFTGLIPGIHVNLIAALVTANLALLLDHTSPLPLAAGLVSMATTHTFIDSIPSIYLGAPDEAMADAALPGHKLLLQGRGYEAIRLTVVGSLGALILSATMFPLFYISIGILQPLLKIFIGYILISVLLWMMIRSRSLYSILIVCLSAILGFTVLNSMIQQPLFPMLSGLFGTSGLLLSLREDNGFPRQGDNDESIPRCSITLLGSTLAGFIAAFLPGLGSAQSATLAQSTLPKQDLRQTLILLGGINTVNFILSLATLLAIDKARNGVIVTVKDFLEPSITTITALIGCVLTAGGIAAMIALFIGRKGATMMQHIPYRLMTITVILIITSLALLLSGVMGLVILMTATAIGLIAPLKRVQRSFAMSCLLVPTIMYFL